jgi:phage terminase small subunit
LNATQAAVRAGYNTNTAYSIGQENLTKPVIAEAIMKAVEDRAKRTGITQDRVVQELARIAFSSGADFAKVVTGKVKRKIWDQEKNEYRETEEIKQFVELKDTDELTPDQKAAIAVIKETKFGIAVETCDKVKALELLGKHLGMFKDKVELSGEVKSNPFEGLTTEELKMLIYGEEQGGETKVG